MLSQNFNNYIQQQPQQVTSYQTNSYNSPSTSAGNSYNNSYNNSSLLMAANTLTFNSPPDKISSSPLKEGDNFSFSKTLMDMQSQQCMNNNDLDFDLHYNSETQADKEENTGEGVIDDMDMTSEFERAIKHFEESKANSMDATVHAKPRILNNPINFNKSSDIADSQKTVDFENSPGNSASFAGASYNSTQSTTPQNSVQTNKFATNRTLMKLQLMKQQSEQQQKSMRTNSYLSTSSGQFDSATPTQNGFHEPPQLFNKSSESNVDLNNNQNNQRSIRHQQQNSPVQSIKINNTIPLYESEPAGMPSSLTTVETIPRSVLSPAYQNEIKLDNPTKYHVMQIAKNLQQATVDHPSAIIKKHRGSIPSSRSDYRISPKFKSQSQSLASQASSSSDISILPGNSSLLADHLYLDNFSNSQQSLDSPCSNLNTTRLSSPTGSSFSQADFLDEINEFVPEDFENYIFDKKSMSQVLTSIQIQDEINRIEETLNLPKTAPNENYLSIPSPGSFSQQASSSCPADVARIKQLQGLNLTSDEIKLIVKDRQKKDNHNMIERRRRFNINDRIKELGTILPKAGNGEIKQNKGSILKASVDYIKELKHEVNRSKELEDKFRQMTILNRKLINRIQELEGQNQTVQQTKSTSSASIASTRFNDNNSIKIKQEPQITLLNLVTNSPKPPAQTTQSPELGTNFQQTQRHNQMQKQAANNSNYVNGFYYQSGGSNSLPGSMPSPQQQPSYQHSPQSNFNQQVNSMSAILNDAVLDDLLSSPADPMLCNNMYSENMMDSLNGI